MAQGKLKADCLRPNGRFRTRVGVYFDTGDN